MKNQKNGSRTNGNKNRNYNNNQKRNNNGRKDNRNPFAQALAEQKAARRAEILKRQSSNLDVIEAVEKYLSNKVTDAWEKINADTNPDSKPFRPERINMQNVNDYLTEIGFTTDDRIPVIQFTQILIELANAQMNTRISTDRINIRIDYYAERLQTVFTDRSLNERLENLLSGDEYSVMMTGGDVCDDTDIESESEDDTLSSDNTCDEESGNEQSQPDNLLSYN